MNDMKPKHHAAKPRHGSTPLFGSRTDIGCIREQNEDSLVVAPPLFVVADGMGGHAAGEIASEIAVNTLAECAPTTADAEKLGQAVEQANRDIINAALSGKGREGMGTTCTAAVLEGNRLVIAQVGDSRAYLLHEGKLRQITRDHSLMANMIEAGQITPEEARVHPNRSVITRALGNDPDTVPDLYEINVEDGDRLMLCSDGLSTMLEDDEMQAVLNRNADPQRCATTLVNGAIVAGGYDNVTVIVADVAGSGKHKQQQLGSRTKATIAIIVALFIAIVAGAFLGANAYLHSAAYLMENDRGNVAVYQGVPGDVLGLRYSELVEDTDIPVSSLSPTAMEGVKAGLRFSSLEEAQRQVEDYRKQLAENAAANSSKSASAGSASSASASASSASSASAKTNSASSASAGSKSRTSEKSGSSAQASSSKEANSGGTA